MAMKKVFAVALIIGIIIGISGCTQIRIPQGELAVIKYDEAYTGGTTKFVETLSQEDSAKVRSVLTNAKYNPGVGGCPFDERVSFGFGDQVFLLSLDGCGIICDPQNETYYEVNREDWSYIVSLFERYGGRLQ